MATDCEDQPMNFSWLRPPRGNYSMVVGACLAMATLSACPLGAGDEGRARVDGSEGGIQPDMGTTAAGTASSTTFDFDDGPHLSSGELPETSGSTPHDEGASSDSECVDINQEADIVERPVDIIFVIDNSGSMGNEIAQVRDRINQDFADIIEASGIDYRVIMFTQHGTSSLDVCVQSPLGPNDCSTLDPSGNLDNPPKFYHYNRNVQSTNSLCLLLDSWGVPEPNGRPAWSEYLRPGSFKSFVEITDDGTGCGKFSDTGANPVTGALLAAEDFTTELQTLSPLHFGSKWRPSFRFYSIVGMPSHDPPDQPWGPDEFLQSEVCQTASRPGLAYQQLSIRTGGLRWPVCQNDDFSEMFQAIAKGVVDISQLACAWQLPDPPTDKIYDAEKITVDFTRDDATIEALPRVTSEADCGDGFRLDNPDEPRSVLLCEDTCRRIREHENGEINIGVPCDSIIDPPAR